MFDRLGRRHPGAEEPGARRGGFSWRQVHREGIIKEESKRVRLVFITQFGSSEGGFYSDVLLALLCADAQQEGHASWVLHVYFDGRDPRRNADVRRRLVEWVADHAIDSIVVERVVDTATLAMLRESNPALVVVMIARSEGFAATEGVDWVLVDDARVRTPGLRAHPTDEFRRAFIHWMRATDRERDQIPGMVRVVRGEAGAPRVSLAELRQTGRLPFAPEVRAHVIASRTPPPRHYYTVFGNAGCPYSRDVLDVPAYRGLDVLARDPSVARKGCSFCHMGGDYEKRVDVVEDVVAQAAYLASRLPDLDRVLLSDQSPQSYLPRLLRAAHEQGVRPLRWLFQTRADYFLRDLDHLEAATAEAERTGAWLELYLVGFESFSNEELERYNKGVDRETLIEAVTQMRRLRERSNRRFTFSEAKGHSLILFGPWTRPEDLRESADALRAHGLGEVFNDITWNRLRLYPNLPIYRLAERDGLLASSFSSGAVAETTRQKGYNVEIPWKFKDDRSRLAYELCATLKKRLGRETEIPQLRAIARYAERLAPDELGAAEREIERGIEALAGALALADTPRAEQRGAPVMFAGACNNACPGCANRDVYVDDDRTALEARIDAARACGGPVIFCGREPTVHPAFLSLVARARGGDAAPVSVVTNGRAFAEPGFARAAARSGLTAASVKLFGVTEAVADAYVGVAGAQRQTLAGLRQLRGYGLELELRAPLHAAMLPELPRLALAARRLGISAVRVEVALDEVGLDRLFEAAAGVRRLIGVARSAGVVLHASRLERGTLAFDDCPAPERPPAGYPASV